MRTAFPAPMYMAALPFVLVVLGCSGGVTVTDEQKAELGKFPERDIFIAAETGDVGKLESLLQQDRTLVEASWGRSQKAPLHIAAAAGENAAVQCLLKHGADPLLEDDDGNTALDDARSKQHGSTAKILQDAMDAKGTGQAQ